MVIIIKPTFNCNFRCSYCYLTHQVKSDYYMMPLSVAKVLVEKIVGLSNRVKKSRLFGMEVSHCFGGSRTIEQYSNILKNLRIRCCSSIQFKQIYPLSVTNTLNCSKNIMLESGSRLTDPRKSTTCIGKESMVAVHSILLSEISISVVKQGFMWVL